MSGIRSYNFREGDRSEYLANYLLSGLGLVTPVPRQEDIGYDFYCQLADQEKGNLSFGYPFIIQIKSDSTDSIIFGVENHKNWKKEDIEWLFRLELPLLFGFVDKKKMNIDIYSCSSLSFLSFSNPLPSIIEFKPRKMIKEENISEPKKKLIEGWPTGHESSGHIHIVDLGSPIINLNNNDLYNHTILKEKKEILRQSITMDLHNIMYKNFRLPYFVWPLKIDTNTAIKEIGWAYMSFHDDNVSKSLYSSISPALISLAMHHKLLKDIDSLELLKPLLKKIPSDFIHKELRETHKDLFDI